jgi:hypothetical protein
MNREEEFVEIERDNLSNEMMEIQKKIEAAKK